MTGPELMTAVGFIVMLFGAVAGVWWRVEGKVSEAKKEAMAEAADASREAAAVRAELSAHRLHCAETFITKQGMRESTEALMDAIHGVKTAVDHMTVRVDRIVENQAKARPVRSAS